MSSRSFFTFVCFVVTLSADPLTKQLDIDFGKDVASRNLKGLATRSDGRILAGPVFTDLEGPKLGEILWSLKPAGPNRFVVGTGPDGKVQEVTFNPANTTYTVREVADVAETQAMTVLPLADGSLLVGTSPTAALCLFKDGKQIARVPLPADSVFELLALPDGTILAATGNPGKIYRVDGRKLATAGVTEGKVSDDKAAADKGVVLFGEIRDRNIRRLARLADGRIVAGSSPKGNIYSFPATGGAPLILQENRDSEVVDLLPLADGSFYAAIVASPGDSVRVGKVNDPKDEKKEKEKEEKPGFTGRSLVMRFPRDGFPETVVTRTNIAFYRLAQHQGWLLLTAGESGDAFGYDPQARRSLTFAGSASAQLNDIAPLGADRYLLLRNNAPGLAVLSFAPAPVRELETKRLDLGTPSEIGAFRFAGRHGIELAALQVEVRSNYGSDELEGWTPWQKMTLRDEAFFADGLRGRYVKLRINLTGNLSDFQLEKATVAHLPQNRRPLLTDFRIFAPNLGIIPANEPPPSANVTLAQVLFPSPREGKDDAEKRKSAIMNSQIIPQPGSQIVYWTVNDPDGDALAYTFSIRPENSPVWTELAVNTTDTFVQFETGALTEGTYITRLTANEQSPRPSAQRLSYTFDTDSLLVDRTPPVINDTQVSRAEAQLRLSVEGTDALSLLEGAEFVLNNGTHETVLHPADGILDGRHERFSVEIPEAKAAGATSVEILLYDQAGNSASIRLPLK